MRHCILFIFFWTLICSDVCAQRVESLSVHSGLSTNTLRGNPIIKDLHRSLRGYSFGINFYLPYKKVSIVTGLSYDRIGSHIGPDTAYDGNGNYIGMFDADHWFQYLQLPLAVEYGFGKKQKFIIGGGGFVGYLVDFGEKGKIVHDDRVQEFSGKEGKYKKMNAGLTFRAGTNLELTKRSSVELKVVDNLGLLNLSKVPVMDDGSIKTNSLNILAGWRIKL